MPLFNPSRAHTLTITRDLSAASGSVSYTGTGFQPRWVSIDGVIDSVATKVTGGSAGNARTGGSAVQAGGVSYTFTAPFSIMIDGSNYQTATITSYDADGFTLSWTKVGTPTGTGTFHVLCGA